MTSPVPGRTTMRKHAPLRCLIALAFISACGGNAEPADAETGRGTAAEIEDADTSAPADEPEPASPLDAGAEASDAGTTARDASRADATTPLRMTIRDLDLSANTLAITQDQAYVLVGHLVGGRDRDAGAGVVRLEPDGSVSWRTQLLPDIVSGGPYRQSTTNWVGIAKDESIYTLSQNPMRAMPDAGGGVDDIFAAKLDRSGAVLWTKQFAGATVGQLETGGSTEQAVIDASGNLYLRAEGALMKLSAAGDLIWKKTIPQLNDALAGDADGNLYFVGHRLGPLPNLYETAHGLVRKYDASGELAWEVQLDGSCHPSSVALSRDGSKLYVSGFASLDVRASNTRKLIPGAHACLHRLDPTRGDKTWSVDQGGAVMTYADDIYLLAQEGADQDTRRLMRLNERGEEVWSSKINVLGAPGRSVGITDRFIVSTFQTRLSRVNVGDGQQVDAFSW